MSRNIIKLLPLLSRSTVSYNDNSLSFLEAAHLMSAEATQEEKLQLITDLESRNQISKETSIKLKESL